MSSQNARRHGLTCIVPITTGEGREDIEAFEFMREGLYEYWKPVGWQEEKLVELLIAEYWRLDRAARYEAGTIRSRADNTTRDQQLRRQRRHFMRINEAYGLKRPCPELRESCFGIDSLIAWLEELKDKIETGRTLSTEEPLAIATLFWQPGTDFAKHLLDYLEEFQCCKQEGKNDEAKAWQNACVSLICKEMEVLREKRKSVISNEELDLEASRLIHALPDPITLDRLCRYTTTISRRSERTMHELERLQRMRSGELISPPLKMDVSVEVPQSTDNPDGK